jgi:hypothetical protein
LLTVAALWLAGIGVVGARLVRHPATRTAAATSPAARQQPPPPPPAAAIGTTAPAPSTAPRASPAPTTAPATAPATARPSPAADRHSISAPVNGRRTGTFELVSNATAVNLRAAALGGDLYRISTPAAGTAVPRVSTGDAGIRLFLEHTTKGADTTVDVVLNSRVRWNLLITGGVRDSVLNLSGTAVGRVDLNGGTTRTDLTLPDPDGTMRVRMTGGANRLRVFTAGLVPARVRIRQGAGKVVFDGHTDNGVARGSVFASPGFAGSTDRIDVDAVAGAGTLTLGPA